MSKTALLVRHKALPGLRDDLRRIWERHVKPRALANAQHEAYYFCYDTGDPETISVFQLFSSEAALEAFVGGSWYPDYLAEVATVVAAPPQLSRSALVWAKPV
jgi:quinol monooxygenase YgiN